MMARLGLGAMGAATALIAATADAGDWSTNIDFRDCTQLEETSGYNWYQSGDTIGVRASDADGAKVRNTRLKCVVHFSSFAAIAMVLSFEESIWQAFPEQEGEGGDRRIIVRDYLGEEMVPLDRWPRWKKEKEDPAMLKLGPASWTYLFIRPTPEVTVTLRASDSWPDRQISWAIQRLTVSVLEADQTFARSSLLYSAAPECLTH